MSVKESPPPPLLLIPVSKKQPRTTSLTKPSDKPPYKLSQKQTLTENVIKTNSTPASCFKIATTHPLLVNVTQARGTHALILHLSKTPSRCRIIASHDYADESEADLNTTTSTRPSQKHSHKKKPPTKTSCETFFLLKRRLNQYYWSNSHTIESPHS